MIVFACASCGRKMRVATDLAGKRARCPKCSQLTLIPEPATASSAVSAPTREPATLPPKPVYASSAATATLPPTGHAASDTATLPPPNSHTQPEIVARRGGVTEVPGYEILEELGRGGMGVIYKARQLQPRRLVALKMILSGEHASEDQLARFRSEAEAVARVQHPNIVQIHEVGQHDGRAFLTLEFVPGGNLAQHLRKNPQRPKQAAALLEQLARGVHFAHQRGIVHRDLKPANVLLADDLVPKIADFGLAKQLEGMTSLSGSGPKTQSGAILGTPQYMAPEQAQGKSDKIGPAVDVYALGAMLYEALTKQPPFTGDSTIDLLMKVATEEPKPPRQVEPRIPRDLETICLKCLRKDPQQRYATALELADDLRRFLQEEPIRARRQSTLERGLVFLKRKKELVWLVIGAVVAVILARVLIVPLFMPEVDGNQYAQQQPVEDPNPKGNGPTIPPNNSSTIEKVKQAAAIQGSRNNLTQLAIGLHNLESVNKTLPPAANYSKVTAKPLLSWRVHVLPYVEQESLWKQFKLDEPWDSPHNIQLVEKMPDIYKVNWGDAPPEGHTYYQVFTGPQTMFELRPQFPGGVFGYQGIRFTEVSDGNSNTLLIVEGARAVPWTKPEDIPYHPASPAPKVGGPFKELGICNVVMAEGTTAKMKSTVSDKTLHALITRNGGEVIPPDWQVEGGKQLGSDPPIIKTEPTPDPPQTRPDEGDPVPPAPVMLMGKIDLDNVPLEFAAITLHSLDGQGKTPPPLKKYSQLSLTDGKYAFPNVQPGRYAVTIIAAKNGPPVPARYASQQATPLIVNVQPGMQNSLDLKLKSR